MSSGGLLMATQIPVEMIVTTAPTAGSYYVWTCRVGLWQVQSVTWSQAGGSAAATIDVGVAAQTVAPASATSQLTGVMNVGTGGTTNSDTLGTLIASPTVIAPGTRLVVTFGSTTTALVGVVTIWIGRLS